MFVLPTLLIFGLIVTNVHCGPTLTNRIVGGHPINISEVPFQLSLHYKGDFICGASLIKSDVGLTASHCVCNTNKPLPAFRFMVYAGSIYQTSSYSSAVADIKSHPSYNKNTLKNDVALLKLRTKFTTITKAVLPQPNFEVCVGCNVVVSGWGTTNETGETSPILLAVTIQIVNQAQCKQTYASFNEVTDKMLCAAVAGGNKDSCYGDSGGPLIYGNILVGIVSWGEGCGRPGYPGVYTKISTQLDFINSL